VLLTIEATLPWGACSAAAYGAAGLSKLNTCSKRRQGKNQILADVQVENPPLSHGGA
jgi:hypothetical protein